MKPSMLKALREYPKQGFDGRSTPKGLRQWTGRASSYSNQSTRSKDGPVKTRDTSLPPETA